MRSMTTKKPGKNCSEPSTGRAQSLRESWRWRCAFKQAEGSSRTPTSCKRFWPKPKAARPSFLPIGHDSSRVTQKRPCRTTHVVCVWSSMMLSPKSRGSAGRCGCCRSRNIKLRNRNSWRVARGLQSSCVAVGGETDFGMAAIRFCLRRSLPPSSRRPAVESGSPHAPGNFAV